MGAFDLVEAHIRSDQLPAARELLAEIEAGYAGRPWERGGIARCRGILAEGSDYKDHFEAAVAIFDDLAIPFERARSQLMYGAKLRRDGERRRAREQLRSALATFGQLNAHTWTAEAERELLTTGATIRSRADHATRDELTPRELQIAIQVSEAKTNREIGAALFLSPKTVEAHLGRVYQKLGIHSRAELIRMYAGHTDDSEELG